MTKQPLRVLLIDSHPVQYCAPTYRLLARDPRVQVHVAYCSLQGAETQVDPGFGVELKWDVPLLEGYSWSHVPNRAPFPKIGSFSGLFNPGIWQLIRSGSFAAVVLHTGYLCVTFWIALAAAKWSRIPVLFGTDNFDLASLDGKRWKFWIKKRLWPHLFRLADMAIVVSSGGARLMRSLGIPEDRIAFFHNVVNNDWWTERSESADRPAMRAKWKVPGDAAVILFCGKLQPWKRPQDLLAAFARVRVPDAYLLFAGEGPLRPALESEALSRGISGKVRFLGFVNQSELPQVYSAADVFVLPSQSDAFGLVVNEAMLCRCPAIVSDRVGARFDLVREGETGYVFPCGDIGALTDGIELALSDRARLRGMGEAARKRMASWAPADHVNALVESISTLVTSRNREKIRASA